jgi:hypothetical protein
MFSPCGAPVLKTHRVQATSFPFGAVLKQRRSNVKFGRRLSLKNKVGVKSGLLFLALKVQRFL